MRNGNVEGADPVLAGIAVSGVTPDASGSLWLATESGVMRWREGAVAAVPPGGPPNNTAATSIQFDPDGTMWVLTEGAGLWRLRGGRWHAFTTRDGLYDDLVWRLLDDGFGNFWMTSNRGIVSVPRQQLEDRAAGRRARVEYTLYNEGAGMPRASATARWSLRAGAPATAGCGSPRSRAWS